MRITATSQISTTCPSKPNIGRQKRSWAMSRGPKGEKRPRPFWVKRRRTHYEQMFSAVHPITDLPGLDRRKLFEIRRLLLSLVGERFEPRANCSASYCARPFVFRTVLKLRSTKLWRKMSSPTANCRLRGNL